jgi:hypothetical protein
MGFSGLQTALGENRALIGSYEPKEKLLISVSKYIQNREDLERGLSFQLGLCWGRQYEGGIFLPGTLRDGTAFNIIRTPGSLESQRYVK